MSITKTIGGDRLGSGNKMKTSLHNYNRSTHNLSQSWRSTMAPGVLTPFLVLPALNGDTFDIDLNAMTRTIPTQGPLMGTFKLQMDVFTCPVRLYQGILHNNPLNVGLDMAKIKLPKIHMIKHWAYQDPTEYEKGIKSLEFSNNCLMKYLGVSGMGAYELDEQGQQPTERDFNAVPILAYYDIFKNYYANKQEEKAYVISGSTLNNSAILSSATMLYTIWESTEPTVENISNTGGTIPNDVEFTVQFGSEERISINGITVHGSNLNTSYYNIGININGTTIYNGLLEENNTIHISEIDNEHITFYPKQGIFSANEFNIYIYKSTEPKDQTQINLVPFTLENIDKAREIILESQTRNTAVTIGDIGQADIDFYPYSVNAIESPNGFLYNKFKMNGLCVKTYQTDLFNAWINTEWIDGTNGIAAITTIDTTDGLKLDTLNLAQKVYNMLNRIAVSGGTYEDWQEAVYGVQAIRRAESPIYCGGMSSEIVFEEVISTAQTDEDNKLGTLAGKGTLSGKKGGVLHIKVNEPSFIIGIASITPRIDYTQGNEWYMTELDSMDDLHKPALDGIGFQDLLAEQAYWWGTSIAGNGSLTKQKIGKVPAWINYMTAVNKAFGDFADEEGKNFMILARNYEREEGTANTIDNTTYIEPEKFNYAFAYKELAAQNFWLQIYSKIKARRIMSAKVIPNL